MTHAAVAKSSSEKASKDARFRPFRAAAYSIYLVAIFGFSLLIIVNVFRSVFAMSPGHLPPSDQTLSVRECLQTAESLWQELETHRVGLAAQRPVREADAAWSKFRIGWLERERQAESRCALESHSRRGLNDVFGKINHLMDLYTTHAVQYAGEIGGAVDDLRESLEAAHRDPAAGRLP